MIAYAALVDLLGGRVICELNLVGDDTQQEQIDMAVDSYFALLQAGLKNECNPAEISGKATALCKINDITLLVCFGESISFEPEEFGKIESLMSEIKSRLGEKSARNVRGIFPDIALKHLQQSVNVFFISHNKPRRDNSSGKAIVKIFQSRIDKDKGSIHVGPFLIFTNKASAEEIDVEEIENIENYDIFVFVISSPIWPESLIKNLINDIRKSTGARILVVPGSDEYLEIARKYEEKYEILLCDSVSSDPQQLLVAVLAYSGFSHIQPEIALENWTIDVIEQPSESDEDELEEVESLGHQAFFVVDKLTGNPVYTYFYDQQSVLLDRIPNVVAAISALSVDPTASTTTSVVRTGNLNYAIIERNDLIFTLITGVSEDADAIRSKFAFLPDLYFDEAPEGIIEHSSPYSSPPFTLKLLATLPPDNLPGRLIPVRKNEPKWEKFKEESVKDFIHAIWNTIDGSNQISRMAVGEGPLLVIGALHLLKSLDAIDFKVKIEQGDIPILKTRDLTGIQLPYSNINSVLDFIDGSTSLGEISESTKIDVAVLRTVFRTLYMKGVIEFVR
ncbi:MAG: hypothetical protein GF411_12490 [Candidatus Lokiarchaeota archaeon]|nr:hypothetical protein [Candidatus Lokiarchaeota archaeon]